jgi:hypothetical protein
MGRKIKKQKNEKPNQIVFLCHIVSIKVDKHVAKLFEGLFSKTLVWQYGIFPSYVENDEQSMPFDCLF